MTDPARMVIRQRAGRDCGVSALAMVAGQSYEDTYIAVVKVDPEYRGKRGLYNREIVAIAARLGLQLTQTRSFDIELDDGVLKVRGTGPESPLHRHGHWVAIVDGVIRCPLGARLPAQEYLTLMQGEACTLLQVGRRGG